MMKKPDISKQTGSNRRAKVAIPKAGVTKNHRRYVGKKNG